MAKKAETASSTMDFYQNSLRKFVQFLGQRADEPIGEITKQDVVAFRHSLVGQVSAKTVNHDLKALKMLFKSARRDSAIADDRGPGGAGESDGSFARDLKARLRGPRDVQRQTKVPQTPVPSLAEEM